MNKHKFATGAVSIALAVTMLSTTALAATTSFTDVPDKHWAAPSISEMASKGVVSGVGNNMYAPDVTLSHAEFVTMVVRQFYGDKVGPKGATWYSAYTDAAKTAGIWDGDAEATITRYDMAQLMYNVMKDKGMTITSLPDTSKVSDWSGVPTNYQAAVSACYNMGMLTGVDGNGTFNGTGSMDRAQAAVVMDRLIDSQDTTVPDPAPPAAEKPSGTNVPASMAPQISSCMATIDGSKELFGTVFPNGYYSNQKEDWASTRDNQFLRFHFGGAYKTITFTVLSERNDLLVRAHKPGARPTSNVTYLAGGTTVTAGNLTQVTFDVTSLDEVVLRFGNNQGSYECYNFVITDIQLS